MDLLEKASVSSVCQVCRSSAAVQWYILDSTCQKTDCAKSISRKRILPFWHSNDSIVRYLVSTNIRYNPIDLSWPTHIWWVVDDHFRASRNANPGSQYRRSTLKHHLGMLGKSLARSFVSLHMGSKSLEQQNLQAQLWWSNNCVAKALSGRWPRASYWVPGVIELVRHPGVCCMDIFTPLHTLVGWFQDCSRGY